MSFAIELILGKENIETIKTTEEESITELGLRKKIRLYSLYKKAQNYINLLIDVQGYQMLINGKFNGDPHPGEFFSRLVLVSERDQIY